MSKKRRKSKSSAEHEGGPPPTPVIPTADTTFEGEEVPEGANERVDALRQAMKEALGGSGVGLKAHQRDGETFLSFENVPVELMGKLFQAVASSRTKVGRQVPGTNLRVYSNQEPQAPAEHPRKRARPRMPGDPGDSKP